jgi:tRNA threonylcarbamoyladenosine biosynthesis protein TsaB
MMNKKTILAFDTALGGISAGVITASGHIVSRQVETQRGQASLLVPLLQEILEEGQCGFKNIDLITCTIGPGSFTGLRIGLSTARVLGMALEKPVIGINTLELMSRHYLFPWPKAEGPAGPLLVVLETKRQDFYACYYDGQGQALCEPFAANAEVVLDRAPAEEFMIGGDCLERFREESKAGLDYLDNIKLSDPVLLAQLGGEKFESAGDQGAPQPLYLRGADVSQPKVPPRTLEQV